MRLYPWVSLGFFAVSSVNLSTTTLQLAQQSEAEPQVTIRCSSLPRGVILKRVIPAYPPEARAKGIQGLVRISVPVNKDGVPEKLRVLSSPPELVNASLDAVKQWRYKPYKLNGKAARVETSIDIKYVIPPNKQVARTDKR